MKTHTSDFKNAIKTFGRELDSKITYTIGGTTIELGNEQLNSVTPHYEGAILKSVMKQLDIDSNVEIPLGTILTYQFGVKVSNQYEYINFGNYVVYKAEKQEDTNSWQITCYDKMLYAMKDYESLEVTYPITVRNYINALCTKLGLTFKNANSTFANYNKQITKELYLDEDGKTLGYTFRDVLDELAQVTASTICINENDDELEIRYINNTNDTIDEEYLKDVNVNFGEKYGPVNTIVLSRSAGADNIYYPSTLPSNPIEIKISDNQIMNGNDRDTYMPDIYNKLNGLEYYINDFSSTGICYYNLCDRYNVSIGEQTYSCVMFNDEINVTQGLEENIYTEMPEESVTDYKKSDTTDRRINQTTLIVDKQQSEITALVDTTEDIQKEINPTDTASGSSIYLEDSTNAELVNFEMEGKTTQETSDNPVMPSPDYPSELVSVGYENLINKEQIILGYFRISDGTYLASTSTTYKSTELIPVSPNTKYYSNVIVFSSSAVGVTYWNDSGTFISGSALSSNHIYTTPSNAKYMRLSFKYADSDITDVDTLYLIKGTQAHSYIPYGKYGIEIKTQNKNLFDGVLEQGSVNSQGINNTNTTRLRTKNYISVYPNTTYALKVNENTTGKNLQFSISYYDKNDYTTYRLSYLNWTTSNPITFTTPNDCHYIRFLIAYTNSSTINTTDNISKIQVEKTQATTYEPYKSNTYLYTLNEPLRAIGNYKDKLYIDNGMLYVERKIKSIILNGSESGWSYGSTYKQYQLSNSTLIKGVKNSGSVMSNYFVSTNISGNYQVRIGNTSSLLWIFDKTDYFGANANSFKTWLSTHNTEVQYILAEPYIEELGEVDIPSTYKTTTYIDTTDELEPNMNITYVMNTQITNYVQNQVSQIKITEDGILAEVNRKVDNEEIIAKLNLAIEDEQGIIEITGNQVTIDSDYFKLNADGTIKSTGGTIGGYKITDNMLYAETFAKYNYTENDLAKIRNYLMGTGTLTPEEFIKYDVNESGTVTSLDYVTIKFFIEYNVTPTSSAKIIMQTGNSISDNAYVLQDGVGNEILNIGFNGIYYKDINLANTTTYSENELVVGKWIDNKPIYRKVIDIGNLPNTSQTTVNHNISNIERIVKLYGSATRDSDKDTLPIPYVTFNSNNSGGINLYADNVSVFVSTSSDRSSYTGYVVLEYTKTND